MTSVQKIAVCCLALFMAVLLGSSAHAVPAAPVVHTLSQPDGSTFEARQWGDEWLHGWETVEGYTIIFDQDLKSWAYAVSDSVGALVSSSKVVGKTPPPEASQYIRPSGQARLTSPVKRLSKEIALETIPEEVVPPTGTGNIPVILINFSNTTTTYTPTQFSTLLFGTGNYSMRDYYQEVSYGAFSVSGGPAGVIGWYTASNTHNYYGSDVTQQGDDAWPGDLVYEAVVAADATVNFAPYDQDGDCYVDVVAIVHQGTGQEASGISTDIWSHRWNLSSALYYNRSHNGTYTTNDVCTAIPSQFIKINDYIIQPEKTSSGTLQTIGVFAHEYGHALGLPDLYDTDGSSEGIGNWSLMAGGSWNYVTLPGDRPAHMDAWSKYRLGWVTPMQVTGTLTNEPIQQAATAADVYKLLSGSATPPSGEYFLVENRQKAGFDAGLPGAGLLIWHIDESKTTNTQECPGGPPCANHYKVALVQADNLWNLENGDNRGDSGDPYPGSANNTSFTACTAPKSNLYSGTASGVSITSISASASTMTATLSTSGPLTCGGGLYTMNPNATYSYLLANNPISSWLGDTDDGYVDLSLAGFDFEFYGTPVTNIRISTNGYMTFGTAGTAFSNDPIPNVNLPNAIIAPFWDDLNLTGLTGERGVWWGLLGTSPNRQLVIEWRQVPGYGYPTSAYSFEIILYESSDRIKFQYLDVDSGTPYDFGASATVGIENFDGSAGLQFSYNTASLSNGKAIEFIPRQPGIVDFDGDGLSDLAGITSGGSIFYTMDLQTWTKIPGVLSQLVVGDFDANGQSDLAGLALNGSIWVTTDLLTWVNIPGLLNELVVGDFNGDGTSDLAGLTSDGLIFYTTDRSTWTQIPGTLNQLVVGDFNGDGTSDLAGLTSDGLIFYTTDRSTWTQIPGTLDQLVVGDFNGDGTSDLAGLTSGGLIYYTTNRSTWNQIPGVLDQLVVGDFNGDGTSDLAGLTSGGLIFYTTNRSTWTQIPGTLDQLVVGDFDGDGLSELAGLTSNGLIFYTTNLSIWTQIPGVLLELAE